MSDVNNSINKYLKKKAREVGAEIQNKLLPKPGYPIRNAYAHIFKMIKEICQCSYTDADPIQVDAIIEAIRLDPNGRITEIIESAKNAYDLSLKEVDIEQVLKESFKYKEIDDLNNLDIEEAINKLNDQQDKMIKIIKQDILRSLLSDNLFIQKIAIDLLREE